MASKAVKHGGNPSYPRFLIAQDEVCKQHLLTRLSKLKKDIDSAMHDFRVEDEPGLAFYTVFFKSDISQSDVEEIFDCVKQLQMNDINVGFVSSILYQIIVHSFPNPDTKGKAITGYLEDLPYSRYPVVVNIQMLDNKKGDAVVLIKTEDLDSLLKDKHERNGKSFSVNLCKIPTNIRPFLLPVNTKMTAGASQEVDMDTSESSDRYAASSNSANKDRSNAVNTDDSTVPSFPARKKKQHADASSHSDPRENPHQVEHLHHSDHKHLIQGEEQYSNPQYAGMHSENQSKAGSRMRSDDYVDEFIKLDTVEILEIILKLLETKKILVDDRKLNCEGDSTKKILKVRGNRIAVKEVIISVQSICNTETYSIPVNIRADLGKRLADEVTSKSDWLVPFIKDVNDTPVIIMANDRSDGLLTASFDEREAKRMADAFQRHLLCANIPCDNCNGNALRNVEDSFKKWEKENIITINYINSQRQIEIYGLPKDVIRVVDEFYKVIGRYA